MSIRVRLNALIVGVSVLGLALLIMAMVLNAGPRMQAESESTMRLATEFVETAIASLEGTTDPGRRLELLLDGLKDIRHVHIYRDSDPQPHSLAEEPLWSAYGDVPTWFASLARKVPTGEIPVVVNGQDFGTLVVAPRIIDEAVEIWNSIVNFTLGGALLAVIAVIAMSVSIARMLRPIKDVGNALIQLDAGHYSVAVPEGGPPEIASICRKLNRLASTLDAALSENKRLVQRLVQVQDEERKDLARELHDEFGPYLFAVRAAVTALKGEINRGGHDQKKLMSGCETLVGHVETMQRMNRNVLQKLRPIGLEEYGLKAKLASLLGMLRESDPEVVVQLTIDDDLPARDETSNLTIYRLVQEGVTNALRHAGATNVEVVVGATGTDGSAAAVPAAVQQNGRPIVHVSVADNGRGLPESAKLSYGIAGMSERVWASGGVMQLTNASAGGARLDAWIPIAIAEARDGAAAS
jgi:two-component system, NarL family, sensor histidine kinase UhpB